MKVEVTFDGSEKMPVWGWQGGQLDGMQVEKERLGAWGVDRI